MQLLRIWRNPTLHRQMRLVVRETLQGHRQAGRLRPKLRMHDSIMPPTRRGGWWLSCQLWKLNRARTGRLFLSDSLGTPESRLETEVVFETGDDQTRILVVRFEPSERP